MVRTGIDIVEVARVERLLKRHPQRFPDKVFTPRELQQAGNSPARLAARFAAKEATMKLLGTGWNGVAWKAIQIISGPNGKPGVQLSGSALQRSNELNLSAIDLSMTHSAGVAVAVAVAQAADR